MNILILGGNGFIGTYLTSKFIKEFHSVRILDKVEPCFRIKEVDYKVGDWSSLELITESLKDIDLVFHLISTTIPATSNLDLIQDIKSNLINTVSLLKCMIEKEVKKLVFFSSGGAIYGKPIKIPVSESQILNPISSYGVIKGSIELYLKMFTELYGLKAVVLRPSNIYGNRKDQIDIHGIVSTALNKVKNSQPIVIWGNGLVIRDFIYIDDITDFCSLLIKKYVPGTYNIGNGVGHSLNEIIELIFEVTKRKVPVIYKEQRIFDVKEIVLDLEKIKTTFNWKSNISLRDGIAKIWKEYEGN